MAALAVGASVVPAHAQLTGGAVVAGKATISQPSATSTLITQTSSSAILTWTGFSIPHGSSVTFLQPSSSAIALNRVLGGSPSFLFGTLSANGQVWLINPAGIVVGRGGSISAAGVLLSTADIHNADFLAGNYSFDIPGKPKAGILNRGTITASKGGSVVLAGAHVTNEGLIAAALGSVVMAGASTYAIDFAGDGLLSFAITSGSAAAGALVNNEGTVSAQGGLVLLTAQAATSVLDNVINTSGIVEATSAANENGTIVLSASGGGTTVSGLVDASGKGTGQTGGTVEVLGDNVTLAQGATIDVSGDTGGGTALIGGNFHGAGPERNSSTTTVAAGSIIDADAITNGNGGNIAVWSNDSTVFNGAITADGGAEGGNGGRIETSGEALTIGPSASIMAMAPKGTAGTWLLDPGTLTVDVEAANDDTGVAGITNSEFPYGEGGNSDAFYPTASSMVFQFSMPVSGVSFFFSNDGDNGISNYFTITGSMSSTPVNISSINGAEVTVPGSGINELVVANGCPNAVCNDGGVNWFFNVSNLTSSAGTIDFTTLPSGPVSPTAFTAEGLSALGLSGTTGLSSSSPSGSSSGVAPPVLVTETPSPPITLTSSTTSTPVALPSGSVSPPAASEPTTLTSSGAGGSSSGLTSVADLDPGASLYGEISGGSTSSPADPIADVAPITPAPQPEPLPLIADLPLGGRGSFLFMQSDVPVAFNEVASIGGSPSSDGNNSMWFEDKRR